MVPDPCNAHSNDISQEAHLHQHIWHPPEQAHGAGSQQAQTIHFSYHHHRSFTGPFEPVTIRAYQQQQALPAQRYSINATPAQAGRWQAAAAVKLT